MKEENFTSVKRTKTKPLLLFLLIVQLCLVEGTLVNYQDSNAARELIEGAYHIELETSENCLVIAYQNICDGCNLSNPNPENEISVSGGIFNINFSWSTSSIFTLIYNGVTYEYLNPYFTGPQGRNSFLLGCEITEELDQTTIPLILSSYSNNGTNSAGFIIQSIDTSYTIAGGGGVQSLTGVITTNTPILYYGIGLNYFDSFSMEFSLQIINSGITCNKALPRKCGDVNVITHQFQRVQCTLNYGNCDSNINNGCESYLLSDPNNCGVCGIVCAGITPFCINGICESCPQDYDNCDLINENGCETYTNSVSNCGDCGVTCVLPNAISTCNSGTCDILQCYDGWEDCDDDRSNGCEQFIDYDNFRCGSCDNDCGGFQCVNGTCSNGCTNLNVSCSGVCIPQSNANCGVCNRSCGDNAHCSDTIFGECVCNNHYGNCDGDWENGCEVNLRTVSNCGDCGIICGGANAIGNCESGFCSLTCSPGFADCDLFTYNGCETVITVHSSLCGSCSVDCTGSFICAGGQCVPFSSCSSQDGYSFCSSFCVNLNNDNSNCGECGRKCDTATSSCIGGVCICNTGLADCNDITPGCETNIENDLHNCGVCGVDCSAYSYANAILSCVGGKCVISECTNGFSDGDFILENGCESSGCNTECGAHSHCDTSGSTFGCLCDPGYGDCDIDQANGCESLLNTDILCGSCLTSCISNEHTLSQCIPNGSEGFNCIIFCTSQSYLNCNNQLLCDTNINDDPLNCGSCNNNCGTNHRKPECLSGHCSNTCSGHWANCDELESTGCEVNLGSNPFNCGSCFHNCSEFVFGVASNNITCNDRQCDFIQCNEGYEDCDYNRSNGCEPLNNIPHCGGCNITCNYLNAINFTCINGHCIMRDDQCKSGFGNCDNNIANGCESTLAANTIHCGECNNSCYVPNVVSISCNGGICEHGVCVDGWGECNPNSPGCETNTNSDINNCGSCGVICK